MAALMELVNLTGLLDSSDILGIQQTQDDKSILVTYKTGYVYLYQILENKVLYLWTTKQGLQLTSPAVQLDEEQLAVIVSKQGSQSIRTWMKEDIAIGKDVENKTKLRKPATSICSIPDHPPVVLFNDGSIAPFHEAESHDQKGPIRDGESIVWHCVKTLCAEDACLTILFRNKEDQYNVLVHWLHWEDDDMESSHCDPMLTQINHVTACDVSFTQQGVLDLYVLVSDKVEDKEVVALKHIQLVKDSAKMKLDTITNLDGGSHDGALLMMDDTHAVITGVTSQELSLHKDAVGLIDVNFSAAQQVEDLPKGCAQCKKLFNAGRHLIVACGSHTWAFPYKSGPSKLGILLGKLSNKDTEDTLIISSWGESKTPSHQDKYIGKAKTLLTRLNDMSQVRPEKAIREDLSSLIQCLEQVPSMGLDLQPLVDTCLYKLPFWPNKEIRLLITYGHLPGSSCDKLVNKLVAREETELLSLCLDHIREIPEKALVTCLGYFLRCDNLKFVHTIREDSQGDGLESKTGFSTAKAVAINNILLQPFSDVFLVECLRSLNFEEVKPLMQYLSCLLIGPDPMSDKIQTEVENQPDLYKVIDWLNLCLDAHFTQLVLSSDTRELLANLHQSVNFQKHFYDELGSLEPLLANLKQKCALPKKKIGQYCIETLHM